MRILDIYLVRLFLTRFAVVLFGLASLMLMLEFLAEGDEVIKAGGDNAMAMLRYMVLRLPQILTRVIPMAVLLAALLTMTALVRHSEMTAIKAAGLSQWRLMLALLPAGLLIAAPQFWIEDRLVPPAVEALRVWGVGEFETAFARDPQGQIWLRENADLVRVGSLDVANRILHDVTIFRRDAEGRVTAQVDAADAVAVAGGWLLRDVSVSDSRTSTVRRLDRMPWDGAPDAEALLSLAAHPREMSFARLRQFAASPDIGAGPQHLYAVWLHRKLVLPVATVVILCLAVPLAQGFSRRSGTALMLAAGIGVGFLYFSLDGLVLALGEAGLVPPAVAAWAPTLVFAAVAATIALQHESR